MRERPSGRPRSRSPRIGRPTLGGRAIRAIVQPIAVRAYACVPIIEPRPKRGSDRVLPGGVEGTAAMRTCRSQTVAPRPGVEPRAARRAAPHG